MGAYYKATIREFLAASPDVISGSLSERVLSSYSGSHQQLVKSWKGQIEILQEVARGLVAQFPAVSEWGVLLEYPILRLQRRLDTVALAGEIVAVIEFKIGARVYEAVDARQVEDYALDVRDFHEMSRVLTVVPILCATSAPARPLPDAEALGSVWSTRFCNREQLPTVLRSLAALGQPGKQIEIHSWDGSPYRAVPTIIEAAERIFAAHEVSSIHDSASDDVTLTATGNELVRIVSDARLKRRHVICFVTGVPGSGKTLTGLNLVHDKRIKTEGTKAAYLSGNTPLVEVLREALARDRSGRSQESMKDCRRILRAEIQHLMDYLRTYITDRPSELPDEHVIVYDEAQRAWDAKFGMQRFERPDSEPALFLDIMGRQKDWAVVVALVGGGQEINKGEGGLHEWGRALVKCQKTPGKKRWEVIAAPDALFGGPSTVGRSIFEPPAQFDGNVEADRKLHLSTSIRSIRCGAVTHWVDNVLTGHIEAAAAIALGTLDFPILTTRRLATTRIWLRGKGRGNRRTGLLASSGARRLRAEGLGVSLSANERDAYVHWYLQPHGDIRSSNALEVTANEYTCQGLELDYTGVCWGGDMLWDDGEHCWVFRELHGARWKAVRDQEKQAFIRNKYRVLLTRARLGMVLWVPEGRVSGVLCVRHTMSSDRRQYAQACKEDAEGQRRRAGGGVAQDFAGTA